VPRSAPPRPSSPRCAKREITWAKFKHCFYATAESSAMIFLIFIGAD
jgi:TRAP-type mannitol/chloroaromatic compound transport system permease large subunit